VFVTVASAHLIYQFWIHSRHIPKLGPLEWVLVTASNHRVHHAQNPAYVDKNYGGLLIVWDRLFGTFEEEREAEPAVYGILGPLKSWNPLWANLHIYAQMLRDAWYTRRWSDKLRVLLARTGWRPGDVAARFPVVKCPLAEFRRYDPPLAPRAAWYAGLQFLALMAFALWLEQAAPAMHATGRAALFACLLFGLVAIGVMLEQPPRGRALERLRLGVTLAAVLGLALTGVAAWPVAAALIAYLAASVILLARTSAHGAAFADS
jgi:alkylglycerol monooxygenase